ncbi:MAG TPA: M28 family metallopeptidase [Solirubrobacteraceae bacterium]|jgi:Zn-dependent M28 family amino/carboxypeptidase|nr:M28 family metallopeptidase [Solirubrobacteraceae bacterium]
MTRAVVLGLVALAIGGCLGSGDGETASSAARVDRFDADRAFADLRSQVERGPRTAGSEASRRLARWLRANVPNGRYQRVPGGLRNVIGSIGGSGKPIVVAAHYDTKKLPGFVGANDGAGGTAAVLEIARALRRADRPAGAPPIRLVLFDGEESPNDRRAFYASGLRGSRHYARRLARRTQAVILLDFVAEKGQMRIPRESGSDIELWARLRAAARKVGAGATFPDETTATVQDDHTPFTRRGVPAIDLIDFTFPCWHKRCDDMSAVSARSLDRAGETVVQLLLDWEP